MTKAKHEARFDGAYSIADSIAHKICGCANAKQHRQDVQAIVEALKNCAEQARQAERDRCAGIAEHAWIICAIDVIMDADAAQKLSERTAQAIRSNQ